jgi:hypothetical protein
MISGFRLGAAGGRDQNGSEDFNDFHSRLQVLPTLHMPLLNLRPAYGLCAFLPVAVKYGNLNDDDGVAMSLAVISMCLASYVWFICYDCRTFPRLRDMNRVERELKIGARHSTRDWDSSNTGIPMRSTAQAGARTSGRTRQAT